MLAAVAAATERLQQEDTRLRKEQEIRERAEKAKAQAAEGEAGAVGDDDDPDETMSCAGTDDAGDDVALVTGIAQGPDGVLAKMLGQVKDEEAAKLRREIAAMCRAYGKQRKAAVAGLGITMIPRYAVADDLASGALIIVLPRHRIAPRPLLAVYPKALVTPAKVQAFVAYLKDWMAERNFDGA